MLRFARRDVYYEFIIQQMRVRKRRAIDARMLMRAAMQRDFDAQAPSQYAGRSACRDTNAAAAHLCAKRPAAARARNVCLRECARCCCLRRYGDICAYKSGARRFIVRRVERQRRRSVRKRGAREAGGEARQALCMQSRAVFMSRQEVPSIAGAPVQDGRGAMMPRQPRAVRRCAPQRRGAGERVQPHKSAVGSGGASCVAQYEARRL